MIVFKVKCKECNNQATIHISAGINAPHKPNKLKEKQGFYCAECVKPEKEKDQ